MSGTKFFRNFPMVPYQFGDAELPINFQNLSIYIDAFDQVREFKSFYQTYQVQNNERPDHVAFKLYGTTDFYWTFFLMNPHLRISGWPLDNSEVYRKSQEYYPNTVIVTDGVATDQVGTAGNRPMSTTENFSVGKWVWLEAQKKAVQIIRVDDPLASLYLDYKGAPNSTPAVIKAISEEDANAINNVDPNHVPTVLDQSSVVRFVDQWDHIHHYEDASGNYTLPSFKKVGVGTTSTFAIDWDTVNTLQSVSYFQRLREKNDENRAISVLKPDTAIQVVAEFNQLLKRR